MFHLSVRLIGFAVLSTLCLALTVHADAKPKNPGKNNTMEAVRSVEGIQEYRLANGLQLLLIPDAAKPTTTVNMTYRVGSRHESYGETGMAHLLEHLLFKGSPKHPQVWAEFNKRGLAANGSTWYDRTNYTASFSANEDNLRWYLAWQADAMVNSFIARKDLDPEMTVVRNEMEQGENSPGRILFEKTLATMYQWHNYGKSTIGARSDVENVAIERPQAFYRRYYQPDNATLIVSGQFNPQQVLAWVAQYFGPLKKPVRVGAMAMPATYTLDPTQDGERSVTLRRKGGVPLIYAGYHIPPAAHPDFAAVELLGLILGDTPAGRLHQRLTEKQLAASTFAFTAALAEPGFAIFGTQLGAGQNTDAARDELLRTVESVAQEPITAEELKRAQATWLKGWEQTFSDPQAVGIAMSETVAQGDWRLFFLQRDRVRAARLADVQRVAQERLLKSNRTLGIYVPSDAVVLVPEPERVDVAREMQSFKPQAAAAVTQAFDASPDNLNRATELWSLGSERGGLRAAFLPKSTRGAAVAAQLTLRYGDEQSLFGQGEVPDFLAAMLDKGTRTLSRQQFQDRLNELKTELSVSSSTGQVTVTLNSRREHLAAAMTLVAQMLREPLLLESSLDEIKRQALAGIESQRKEPGPALQNAMARHGNTYQRGDVRYVPTFDEMVQDTQAVTLEKVKAFHQRFYGANQIELAAVGDVDVAALKAALTQAWGGEAAAWKSSIEPVRITDPWVNVSPTQLRINTPDKQNATMRVALRLPVAEFHADYPALMMANYLLGNGGNSRLWKRIRETEGLSYDVRSQINWNQYEPHSQWTASAIFAPSARARVEAAFKEEIQRALKDGFTAEELRAGQTGLLNFRRLSRAQDDNLAGAWVNNLYMKRNFSRSAEVDRALSALTVEQVNAVLRKYIQPAGFVVGFGGDFKE
ncbi:MAG: M16 family metallopeptidase [Burkholderiales bacterium]